MTRQEFIKLVKADVNAQLRQVAVLMVVIISFGAVVGWVIRRWENEIINRSPILLWILVGLTACFFVTAMFAIRFSNQLLLKCPHCRKLLGGFSSQVVVASGNCGYCGQRIIDEG